MKSKEFFIDWFKEHGRAFPWRKDSTSPFSILLAEMLLRQTRASNVAKIWPSLSERYPDAASLAVARKATLVRQLRILGFGNQRAEALLLASRWLLEHHKGKVPSTLKELLRIPHIGHYSARAVLAFAYGKRTEIVDSNVLRFLSRYHGLSLAPDIRRTPEAWELARKSLPRGNGRIREHNYGLLDFTAAVCKSGKPRCEICPLADTCSFAIQHVKLGTSTNC